MYVTTIKIIYYTNISFEFKLQTHEKRAICSGSSTSVAAISKERQLYSQAIQTMNCTNPSVKLQWVVVFSDLLTFFAKTKANQRINYLKLISKH